MESIHVLRLDDKSGPEGCIFHGTNTPGRQSLPQIIFPGKDIPIHMSALRPSMYPVGLHQDPKATCCSVETTGNVHDCQHRQLSHPGRVQEAGSGTCHRPNISSREPRFCDNQNVSSLETLFPPSLFTYATAVVLSILSRTVMLFLAVPDISQPPLQLFMLPRGENELGRVVLI